jgi:ribosomal RNA-processing protein 8
MDFGFRYYQKEADEAIHNDLLVNKKCLVKMFCGTGKSRLMRYCKVAQNKNLVVYVVPSLSLLDQFYTDYLKDFPLVQRISCEEDSTTDKKEIVKFLKKKKNKIICVTYQSFETLINSLVDIKIDVCIFDEAHHAIGKTYQSLIFETDVCEKQIFFTATPKNANGVIMYDKDNLDAGMCGNLVYDYSYFKGALEGYLNPFEIRIDFYTENTNNSVYESIARAVLASGNSRVLTFHADVNGDSDTSVLRFVNEELFIVAFNKVLNTEFPEKIGYYKRIQMIGLRAEIDMKVRKRILTQFDTTPDDEVFVISSCQTIGEGIDTKNANMCVFVDPKSSIVSITQNFGRIVRKIFGLEKPNSTISINCLIDKDKYLACNGDKDKCDEVIRQDMNKDGNFNSILNVMSAVKQESEDLFDACLNYPSTYSPQEIEGNLARYGYQLEDPISLVESLEHVLDTDIDLDEDDLETDEELLARTAEENNVVIEVHSNSLETPVEYYGLSDETDKEVVRIFRLYDEESEENVYQPIVKKDGSKRNKDIVEPLRRDNRFNVKVHTNPDVKLLWNLSSDFDLSRDICSCIIDCEVVDIWPQRFEELKAFIDANERRPLINVKFPSEKKMSQWLVDQNKYYKKKTHGMKIVERYELWTQFLEEYKEYFMTKDDLYSKRIEELRLFINKKSSLPSTVSHIKEEKILGKWVGDQQKNYKNKTAGMKDNTRYNLWRQILEDYKEYFDKWGEQINKLKLFIQINKRTPSSSSKNICEQLLSRWTINQKKNYKNKTEGMKDEERYNLWRQFLEDYKEYFVSDNELWFLKFEYSKTFITENKRIPSRVSKNQEEKKISEWVGDQQKNYKNKTAGMKDKTRYNLWTQFLEDYKEYFITIDELWLKNLDSCKSFIQINEKIPYQTAKNSDEKYLGRWISTQQKDYKKKTHGMKEQSRYNEWTQFLEEYKEYFISWDESFYTQLQELKLFIQINKKKPSQSSKDLNEKKISKWLSMQQHTYKNKLHGMKDEERYNLWTQFLEEYKDYFNDNPIVNEEDQTEETEEVITIKPKQKKSAKLPKVKEEKIETKEDVYTRTKPPITQFHNKFCKMLSGNLAQYFKENPNDFAEYHRVRDECFKTFEDEDIPCNRIITELKKFKTRKTKQVVDMGCGTANISEYFKEDNRFKFTNYDHVAINDTVQVCDISHMPLEDDSIDICIMSLALWGSNCEEYIQEAFRVLDSQGTLYIIDSTKRWSEKDELQNIIPEKEGYKLKQLLEKNNFNIVSSNIDKWCLFKCTK